MTIPQGVDGQRPFQNDPHGPHSSKPPPFSKHAPPVDPHAPALLRSFADPRQDYSLWHTDGRPDLIKSRS